MSPLEPKRAAEGGGTRPRGRGRESRRALGERARALAERLAAAYPQADCELRWSTPWELLVATILSAQCTDERVNRITPALFERFPEPRAFASARLRELEEAIRPTGFFRQKARALRACAQALLERFGGRVPAGIEELTELPGVGRKTASVVAATAFGLPAVFVDTHVARLARRLGLSGARTPEGIERDLKELLPADQWTRFCHRLIHHGRRVCKARRPRCERCSLADLCPRLGLDSPQEPREIPPGPARRKNSGGAGPESRFKMNRIRKTS